MTDPISKPTFIVAHGTDGIERQPEFLEMTVDDAFIEALKKARQICVDNDYSEVRFYYDDVLWESEEYESDVRLESTECVVDKHMFYFNAMEKHTDCKAQTTSIMIDELINRTNDRTNEFQYFDGGRVQSLEVIVERVKKDALPEYLKALYEQSGRTDWYESSCPATGGGNEYWFISTDGLKEAYVVVDQDDVTVTITEAET